MDSVPIIDVGGLRSGSPDAMRELAAEIGAAARTIGFFTIRNHGVPAELTERLFSASASFFALPDTEKDRYAKTVAGTKYVGYVRLGQESPDASQPADYKESILFMRDFEDDDPDFVAGRPFVERNPWPPLPGYHDTVMEYFNALQSLAMDLHRALAIDVGTDADAFVACFDRPLSGLNLLHYPPPPPGFTGVRYGAAPHTDFGGFTLLAQDDVGGLELRRVDDGTWIPVDPVPGALVCNIGDALMRWTNDVYISNQHRVVNRAQRSRYSAAFFCDPNGEAVLEPLAGCVSADHPAKYPPITYANLLKLRLEELQLAT
jgi:isopenicillin N synthase-like dioxygenase